MILVIVDRFSKKAYFLPCNTTITSQGVANLYRDHVFKEHGLPKKVISDRGSQFVSGFMKGLYQNLGIEANPSTAYHPQTDGQTERVNQELEEYLRIYVNEQQNDWVDWLPIAQFCHNDRSHSATGFSPFMITTGRHPFKGIYTGKETTNQTAEKYIEKFKETWKTMEKNLEQAAKRMKRQHNKHVKPSRQYQPGDRVYLDASKIKSSTDPSRSSPQSGNRPINLNYLLDGASTTCFMSQNLNRLMNHNSPNRRKRDHGHRPRSLTEMKNTRLKKSKESEINKEKNNSL
jgi:hypothetical protein